MARLHTSFASLIALLLAYMLGSALARLRTILFETLPKHDAPLRIALFGAASIAPHGLLYAAQRAQSVSVVSVASRSTAKARTLAAKWGIAHYGSYEEVLADANVDAVYIALINGAHYHWAAKALRAGKHVLCEKPLTSNAEEARELERIAGEVGRVLMEAYHTLHHPLAARMLELVQSKELGELRHLEITAGLPSPGSLLALLGIRSQHRPAKMRPELGGGKFLGQGCYMVSLARFLLGEPTAVHNTSMAEDEPGSKADVSTTATLVFRNEASATLRHSSIRPGFDLVATFDGGSFTVRNYLFPFIWHSLSIEPQGGEPRTETHYTFAGEHGLGESTFTLQLRAFAATVKQQGGGSTQDEAIRAEGARGTMSSEAVLQAVSPKSAVRNMELIDEIYSKAGLGRRPSMPS